MKQYRNDTRARPDLVERAQSNYLKFAERKLSAQELADGIDAYFKECEDRGKKPTKPGLCTFLNISTSTWDNWMREGDGKAVKRDLRSGETGEGRFSAYVWPMKRAMQVIADGLEQRTDTMAMFLLKQPCYGGYSDKCDGAVGGGNMAITISFGEVHKNTARGYGK